MSQIIQNPVILHQILCDAAHRDLIGKTPHDDRRMVVILRNQFLQLTDRIFPAARHMNRNVRNLCPDNHAPLITQIIEELIVLIVSKSNRIGTHLADQIHILNLVRLA